MDLSPQETPDDAPPAPSSDRMTRLSLDGMAGLVRPFSRACAVCSPATSVPRWVLIAIAILQP